MNTSHGYKLYGSQNSPYVRRLRLLLENKTYEFISVDLFNPTERASFLKISPLLKIPVFEDGNIRVFDSRLIFRYLQTQGLHRALTWDEENLLTIIDGLADSLIQILLMKRSEINPAPQTPIYFTHHERVPNTLNYLNNHAEAFKEWNYPSICLYTTLDWASFRGLISLENYPHLTRIMSLHAKQAGIESTRPH